MIDHHNTHCDYAEVVGKCLCWIFAPHVLCPHTTGSCSGEYNACWFADSWPAIILGYETIIIYLTKGAD